MARALGTDDSVNTCDCCGKKDLKYTVVIELDDGEIVYYGSTCASRNTGKSAKVIGDEIRTEAQRIRAAAAAEYRATPEHAAYLYRLCKRDRLSWDDPRRMGRAGFDFVREAAAAADQVRDRIAAKFGIRPVEVQS